VATDCNTLSLDFIFFLRETATALRYYPSTAPVFLRPPLSCRHQSRPFSSASGLHSRSSQRLATQNR